MRVLLRIVGYSARYRIRLLLSFLAVLGFTAFTLTIPRLLGISIDAGLSSGELRQLILLGIVIVVVSVGRGIAAFGRSYLSESLSEKVAYDLRNDFYDHLQHMSFAYHDKQQTGDLMSRATSDVEGVREFVHSGIVSVAYSVILLVAIGTITALINWKLALISLAFAPVVAWRTGLIALASMRVWSFVQRETGALITVLQENLSGQRVVKAFDAEEYEEEKFHTSARKVYSGSYKAKVLNASNSSMMTAFHLGVMGLIVWVGGRDVIAGRMTPGELAQFILYLNLLVQPIRTFGAMVEVFTRAISGGKRLFSVLDAQSPVKEKPRAITMPRLKGHVRFEEVAFQYVAGGPPVLNHISFEAQPGQTIALVGAPGSGKTTVAHLLPRFYDVSRGRIIIDGSDIRDVALRSLRNNIGIVQQDVFLFTSTIRENIAYGRVDASAAQITQAAKIAQLHDFITTLPRGYDTWVGERGSTLSGGQRQRLAIARALELDPPILILDDSTSSVDTHTEHLIQQSLQDIIRGRTTFVIAHRLSTVKNADLILVMEHGEIVQRGTHQELVAQPGPYHRIYELQLRPHEAVTNGHELKVEEDEGVVMHWKPLKKERGK